MKRYALAIGLATVIACWVGVAGQEKGGSVAGRWTMTVEGSPHGALTLGLALKQEGVKVTGTFASPHGDLPVEGKLEDAALTMATVSRSADAPSITFHAKLKDDKLTGYLSSDMGDMPWTAVRAKEK